MLNGRLLFLCCGSAPLGCKQHEGCQLFQVENFSTFSNRFLCTPPDEDDEHHLQCSSVTIHNHQQLHLNPFPALCFVAICPCYCDRWQTGQQQLGSIHFQLTKLKMYNETTADTEKTWPSLQSCLKDRNRFLASEGALKSRSSCDNQENDWEALHFLNYWQNWPHCAAYRWLKAGNRQTRRVHTNVSYLSFHNNHKEYSVF